MVAVPAAVTRTLGLDSASSAQPAAVADAEIAAIAPSVGSDEAFAAAQVAESVMKNLIAAMTALDSLLALTALR